jgi:hypothetical protein
MELLTCSEEAHVLRNMVREVGGLLSAATGQTNCREQRMSAEYESLPVGCFYEYYLVFETNIQTRDSIVGPSGGKSFSNFI